MIQYVVFRCFSYATENPEKVRRALEFVAGAEGIKEVRERGYHGNEIVIMEKEIRRKREVRDFWKRLKEAGVVDEIIFRLDELMDESGNLYLRFDKQEAYLGRFTLSWKGDVIAVRAKVNSYPMKKEKAIENFKKYVEEI